MDKSKIHVKPVTSPSYLVLCASVAAALAVGGCDRLNPPPTVKQAPVPVTSDSANVAPPAPAASSAGASQTIGSTVDDALITTKVKSILIADPEIKGLAIAVETRKGEVLLSGFANSQLQIDRAVDIARRTEHVKAVDNKISLKAPGASVGTVIDDSLVTTKVKAALLSDVAVKGIDVNVSTSKGVVQLSGFVDNNDQIARATAITRSVEGVKDVINKMTLKK